MIIFLQFRFSPPCVAFWGVERGLRDAFVCSLQRLIIPSENILLLRSMFANSRTRILSEPLIILGNDDGALKLSDPVSVRVGTKECFAFFIRLLSLLYRRLQPLSEPCSYRIMK